MRVLEAKLLNGTAQQYQALDEAIRTAQFVRNKCLRHWMDHQGVNRATLYSLCKDLAREFPFAQKLNSQARQASAERAWSAISNFYRRCQNQAAQKGYPQFQKHCRSVEYKVSGWKLSQDGMFLTFTDGFHAGTFALYCNGEARRDILTLKINRVRVIRRADGYYAQFCLDVERREQAEYTGQAVGLDMGLTHFYTDSHGHKVECPQFLRRAERRLKREQRRLSRKLRTPSRLRERRGAKPQSKNYHQQRKRLGKVHLKVQRQRRDWAVKLARCVVLAYGGAERFV
jgi:putative transposase